MGRLLPTAFGRALPIHSFLLRLNAGANIL